MTSWLLRYEGYDPATEPLREALCTLGNGRFATRGAAPETRAGGVHYPGTYAAGVFNRLAVNLDGHAVENESMVNLPDWQSLAVAGRGRRRLVRRRLHGGVRLLAGARPAPRRAHPPLPVHRPGRAPYGGGPAAARVDGRPVPGRRSTPRSSPENWSGRLEVRSGLDGRVRNGGVARYHGLGDQHLRVVAADGVDCDTVALDVETTQSHVLVSLAARHRVLVDGIETTTAGQLQVEDGYVGLDLQVDLEQRRQLHGGEGGRRCSPRGTARSPSRPRRRGTRCGARRRFDAAARPARARLGLPLGALRPGADRARARRAGRSTCTCSTCCRPCRQHSVDLDVGIPARGLHGEAYRGHVFWDEMFVFPYLTLRMPDLSRSAAALPVAPAAAGAQGGARGRDIAAPCSPGRAARAGGRRRRRCTSTRGRAGGCRTTRGCSGTSGWPSRTTPGSTTRQPATSTSSPATARS